MITQGDSVCLATEGERTNTHGDDSGGGLAQRDNDAAPTATVLQATRRLLPTGVPPDSAQADERYHAIVSYLAVLSHRGIDTEPVLKIALMSDVVVSLVAPALVNLVAPDVDPETAPDGNLSEWGMLRKLGGAARLEAPPSTEDGSLFADEFRVKFDEVVSRAERLVATWISTATVDDIIRLTPPE